MQYCPKTNLAKTISQLIDLLNYMVTILQKQKQQTSVDSKCAGFCFLLLYMTVHLISLSFELLAGKTFFSLTFVSFDWPFYFFLPFDILLTEQYINPS